MPPKLLNDEGDLFVLRPLAHVAEADCDAVFPGHGLPDHPL
jgi:tRNA 2-thiocytidine biosynthesis protein TtcA